jgi:hypothetical protein
MPELGCPAPLICCFAYLLDLPSLCLKLWLMVLRSNMRIIYDIDDVPFLVGVVVVTTIAMMVFTYVWSRWGRY